MEYVPQAPLPAWQLQYLHNYNQATGRCNGPMRNAPGCPANSTAANDTPAYVNQFRDALTGQMEQGINPNFWHDYSIPDWLPGDQQSVNFWEQYNEFFPIMSNFPFGSNMLANLGGSFATLQGGLMPYQNQAYAMTGPEAFPTDQTQNASNQALNADPAGVGTGQGLPIDPNSRIGKLLGNIGLGFLALLLLALGIYYLVQKSETYQEVKGAIVDEGKKAAKAAALA